MDTSTLPCNSSLIDAVNAGQSARSLENGGTGQGSYSCQEANVEQIELEYKIPVPNLFSRPPIGIVSVPDGQIRVEGSQTQDVDLVESGHGNGRLCSIAPSCQQRPMSQWSKTRICLVCVLTVAIGALLLFVSLFPASFVYVDYYEYALHRNSFTGKVDYSQLYGPSCNLMAPWDEMIKFKASAHHVEMTLKIMNKDFLGITLHLYLQYFLKPTEIVVLYKRYNLQYPEVMKQLIQSTVKNTAVNFSLDKYRLRRHHVEAELESRVRYVLSGDCCPSRCPNNHTSAQNTSCGPPDCLPVGQCYVGRHVELRYFQMGRVSIPDEVMDLYLRSVVLQIQVERELYLQETAVEEKKTEALVKNLLNQAREVTEAAEAKSRVILAKANADAELTVQVAYQSALVELFDRLNITAEENKLSFIYTKTLWGKRDMLFAFDYDVNRVYTP
ncbi:uncharacterized protein LOC101857183 isoform X2 [Aplysia californica]|uniref:Uncharacterized protein LOC101857183 isoform X2 n=1 Tax=Aplysia californica TaxID=6500 RepID=A0ABM0JM21_APLCA|nr:uncharacterized protein LOC101857183 isoform X2 [Aplysia californica]